MEKDQDLTLKDEISEQQNPKPNKSKKNIAKPKKEKIKISKNTKKSLKVKKTKEEKDYGTAIKEYPKKLAKEINKIKWSGWDNLKKKYIVVLLFMVIFALVFFAIGLGIQELFQLAKIY